MRRAEHAPGVDRSGEPAALTRAFLQIPRAARRHARSREETPSRRGDGPGARSTQELPSCSSAPTDTARRRHPRGQRHPARRPGAILNEPSSMVSPAARNVEKRGGAASCPSIAGRHGCHRSLPASRHPRPCSHLSRRSCGDCSHHGVPRSPSAVFATCTRERAVYSASESPATNAVRTARRADIRWCRRRAAVSAGSDGSVARHRRPSITT